MNTAKELRQSFLEYFEKQHRHRVVRSAPIVPPDDPTMLFTSAGMVQFKPFYAGTIDPLPYTRAATCQKCLRAGGKASDLENVGKTLRHHTFFEMLGNFSFGDYFKREALLWGWDFVWNKMKLPKERLWATIFDEDDEAEALLEKEVGISSGRIIRLDSKENFWGPAGETGACGPCSEICFFMGSEEALAEASGQDKETIARRIVEEGDLFLEIWNMVFPQFDQQPDGSRLPLKNRGIDTGAGLERMTTVLQFVETGGKIRSPYQTELLSPITRAAAELLHQPVSSDFSRQAQRDMRKSLAINAVADHARTLTFALSEGIVPSNEGRGYVLRRILRRAGRFGFLLGVEEPFLYRLVDVVVETMGDVYPEIRQPAAHAAEVIRIEEERFMRTVAQGTKILDEMIARGKDSGKALLDGDSAFLLHATYGFPVDLTAEVAEDAGLQLDREGFERAMRGHREEARKSWKGAALGREAELLDDVFDEFGETEFLGYETTEAESRVAAIIRGGERAESIASGEEAVVVLEETPFYAEAGGQVGDTGVLESGSGRFKVSDTSKTQSGIVLHRGVLKGELRVGDAARAEVDAERRLAIMRNHTVTHLLQAALKQTLGAHVTQSGSYVGPDGMRFDFSHPRACAPDELARVERLVNESILADHPVRVEEMDIEQARESGAIAPFGEKYGHRVRVVRIGSDEKRVSIEFCGGTHLDRTGRIGSFRLTAESSVAAGMRRIEGVTGAGAYQAWAATRDTASALCRSLAIKEEQLGERVAALQEEVKRLQKEMKKIKQTARAGADAVSLESLLAGAKEIVGAKGASQDGAAEAEAGAAAPSLRVICATIPDAEPAQLRDLADRLREKASGLVCVLGSVAGDKVSLLCAVSKDATGRVKAGDVIREVAAIVGGSGGGRPDLAQAGGKYPEKIGEAIEAAAGIVEGLVLKR